MKPKTDGSTYVEFDNGCCKIGGSRGVVEVYSLHNIDTKNVASIIPVLRGTQGVSFFISYSLMKKKSFIDYLKKLITRTKVDKPNLRALIGLEEDPGKIHGETLEKESRMGTYNQTYHQVYDEGQDMIPLVITVVIAANDDETLVTLAEKLEDELALYASMVREELQRKSLEEVMTGSLDPGSHHNVTYLTSAQFLELVKSFPRRRSLGGSKHLIGYANDEAICFNLDDFHTKVLIFEGPPNSGKTYMLSLIELIFFSLKTKGEFVDFKGDGNAALKIENIFRMMQPHCIIKYGIGGGHGTYPGINVLEMFKDPKMNGEFIDGLLSRMGFTDDDRNKKTIVKEMITDLNGRIHHQEVTLLSLIAEIERRIGKEPYQQWRIATEDKDLEQILGRLRAWTDGSLAQMFCSTAPVDLDEAVIVYHDLSEVHNTDQKRMIAELIFLRNVILSMTKGLGRRTFFVDETHVLPTLESKWINNDVESMVSRGRAFDFWSIFALQLKENLDVKMQRFIVGNASAVFKMKPLRRGHCTIEYADGRTIDFEVAASPGIHEIITGSSIGSKEPEEMKRLGRVAYRDDLDHDDVPRTHYLVSGHGLDGKEKVFVVDNLTLRPLQDIDIFLIENILKELDIKYSVKEGIITCDALDMSLYVPTDEPTPEEFKHVSSILDSLGLFYVVSDKLPEGTPDFIRDLTIPRAKIEAFILERMNASHSITVQPVEPKIKITSLAAR